MTEMKLSAKKKLRKYSSLNIRIQKYPKLLERLKHLKLQNSLKMTSQQGGNH